MIYAKSLYRNDLIVLLYRGTFCLIRRKGQGRMKRRNVLIILSLMAVAFPAAAFANSSWYWISEQRPWDILPWVAIATILIEVLAIWLIPKTKQFVKTTVIVVVANLVSFLLPYGVLAGGDAVHETFQDVLNAGPVYIVSVMFLIMTLAVELPVVYKVLKKHVKNKKLLLWTIIGTNTVTTIMVAIVERMITEGAWA